MSLIIDNYELREKIHLLEEQLNLYKHDALTGLLLRRDFEEKFFEYFNLGIRFYLTLIDINGLHNINSNQGYVAGDTLIKNVASNLIKNCNGLIYRIGGDEFAILGINSINCVDKDKNVSVSVSSEGFKSMLGMFNGADDKMKLAKKEHYKNSNERRV